MKLNVLNYFAGVDELLTNRIGATIMKSGEFFVRRRLAAEPRARSAAAKGALRRSRSDHGLA